VEYENENENKECRNMPATSKWWLTFAAFAVLSSTLSYLRQAILNSVSVEAL